MNGTFQTKDLEIELNCNVDILISSILLYGDAYYIKQISTKVLVYFWYNSLP